MAPFLDTAVTSEPDSFVTLEDQLFSDDRSPLPYTSNPWGLLVSDLILILQQAWSIPFVLIPIYPWNSGRLDELYPSRPNLFDLAVHTILFFVQLTFLILVPLSFFTALPFPFVLLSIAGFVIVNKFLCDVLLNGKQPILESKVDISHLPQHDNEKWIFINGVSVGHHWLQSNIDRLSMTFGRKVTGVHNPTSGIPFDLIQCIVQRDFSYATDDIRNGYVQVKNALSPKLEGRTYSKVVLILHSQGGIEGGAILDWLLAELSGSELAKLEIYTFGNAANHWNNPARVVPDRMHSAGPGGHAPPQPKRVIPYIEHYANSYDFVSRWGVLHFAGKTAKSVEHNRFAGHIFERPGKGHLLNQHYLDAMFPLTKAPKKAGGYPMATEDNQFMKMQIQVVDGSLETKLNGNKVTVRGLTNSYSGSGSLLSPYTMRTHQTVGEVSRLWKYRNGQSPQD